MCGRAYVALTPRTRVIVLGFAEVCEVKLVVTVVDLWFWKLLCSELCSAMSSMALGGAVEANLAEWLCVHVVRCARGCAACLCYCTWFCAVVCYCVGAAECQSDFTFVVMLMGMTVVVGC